MKETLKLSFEMTDTLSRIEHNGLKINLETLAQIEKEYEQEMHTLEIKLRELAKKAMGDTPINLASPDDKSMLLYSRKVKDKSLWSMTFNLGHEMRGNTIKPKMRTRMKNTDFVRYVRQMTDIVYKTIGRQCLSPNWSTKDHSALFASSFIVRSSGDFRGDFRVKTRCKPCANRWRTLRRRSMSRHWLIRMAESQAFILLPGW